MKDQFRPDLNPYRKMSLENLFFNFCIKWEKDYYESEIGGEAGCFCWLVESIRKLLERGDGDEAE